MDFLEYMKHLSYDHPVIIQKCKPSDEGVEEVVVIIDEIKDIAVFFSKATSQALMIGVHVGGRPVVGFSPLNNEATKNWFLSGFHDVESVNYLELVDYLTKAYTEK